MVNHLSKVFIDKLAFIEVQNFKLLVTLNKGLDTWYIPGGKREGNETDQEALIREVKEELTVIIKPETILLYGIFEAPAHNKPAGTVVRLTCYTAEFSGELTASSEIEKIDFFGYEERQRTSTVDHLIFDDLNKKDFVR